MVVQTPTAVPQHPIGFSDLVVSEDSNTHFSHQSKGTLPFKPENAKQRCIPALLPNKCLSGVGEELLSLFVGWLWGQPPAAASPGFFTHLAEAVQCSLGVEENSGEKR